MRCNKCGMENNDMSTTCSGCGNDLSVNTQPQPTAQPQPNSNAYFGQNIETNNLQSQQAANNFNLASAPRAIKKISKKTLFISGSVILLAIIGIISYFLFFSGNVPAGQIRPLNVSLEKMTFKCGNNECTDLNSKILAVYPYDAKINDISTSTIALTSDGSIYAFDVINDGNAIKIEGDVKLKSIDAIVDMNGYDKVLKSGDSYYSITDDAKIVKIDNKYTKMSDVKQFFDTRTEAVTAVDKDSNYVVYYSCKKYKDKVDASYCKSDDDWIKVSSDGSSFLSKKIKSSVESEYITEDNMLYTTSYMLDADFKTMKFKPYLDVKYDPILEKVTKIWEFAGSYATNYTVAQTEDNTVYFYKNDVFGDDQEYKYSLNEKVEDIYPYDGYCFAIKTSSKIYLALYNDYDENDNEISGIKEYPDLTKYKDNVRGLYRTNDSFYMLLSDGNMYKFYDTIPAYKKNK